MIGVGSYCAGRMEWNDVVLLDELQCVTLLRLFVFFERQVSFFLFGDERGVLLGVVLVCIVVGKS